jgi:Tfp pilus assembly protein PilN
MPTLEWLRYGAQGLGLALAAYSFFLVRRALKTNPLNTPHLSLIVAFMLFSLSLACIGFYSQYLANHDRRFARTAANALLTESHINMRQDVAHCQSFLQRTALFLQAVGDDRFAAVEQDSRISDTRCEDGINNVVPILGEYAK